MIRWILLVLSVVLVYVSLTLGTETPETSEATDNARLNRIYRDELRAPKMNKDQSDRMQQLVRQLEMMTQKLPDKPQPKQQDVEPTPQPVVKTAPATQPVVKVQPQPQPEPAPKLDAETLKFLRDNAGDAVDPIRLADALYGAGYGEEAYDIYKSQLERVQDESGKSWLLYQMANCHIQKNPLEARQLLRQLVSEYGNSQWATPAETQLRVLEWIVQDKPGDFLQQLQRELDGDVNEQPAAETSATTQPVKQPESVSASQPASVGNATPPAAKQTQGQESK